LTSIKQVVQRIEHFADAYNTNCGLFKWIATVNSILSWHGSPSWAQAVDPGAMFARLTLNSRHQMLDASSVRPQWKSLDYFLIGS